MMAITVSSSISVKPFLGRIYRGVISAHAFNCIPNSCRPRPNHCKSLVCLLGNELYK
jgi:hypothetical protein